MSWEDAGVSGCVPCRRRRGWACWTCRMSSSSACWPPPPTPLRNAPLLAICTHVFRVLAAHATSLKLGKETPFPRIVALLRSAAALRHLHITDVDGTWPLTQLLPHLPRVETLALHLDQLREQLPPASLREVRLESLCLNRAADVGLVTRLQQHLARGTAVVEVLFVDGAKAAKVAKSHDWGAPNTRTPHIEHAEVSHGASAACLVTLTALTSLEFCGMNNRTRVPKVLGRLAQLRTLTVHRCDLLCTLPRAISGLTALTRLAVAACENLEALPPQLRQLRSLKELFLHNLAALRALPPELGDLPALEQLCVYDCGALPLPSTLGRLSTLTHLAVNDPRENAPLPSEISSLVSLQYLEFITGDEEPGEEAPFPAAVCHVTSLQTLRLSQPADSDDLASLSALQHLHTLQLDLTEVYEACPPFFTALSALTALTLTGCDEIARFPKDWSALACLRVLHIYEASHLESFPRGIKTLPALRRLEISHLDLKWLPESISTLTSLTSLSLPACNELEDLPPSIGRPSRLAELSLRDCATLFELPETLGNLCALSSLDLSGCRRLLWLPARLACLKALRQLKLRNCGKLETLPGVRGLSALGTLDLAGCTSLRELPADVGALSALKTLDMTGCKALRALPRALAGLPTLRSVKVSGCTKLELPISLFAAPRLRIMFER